MKKRTITSLAAAGILCASALGTTLAYLTDTDQKTNEFTVGKVDMELTETDWDPEEAKKLDPNEENAKNPVITLDESSNDAVVFLRVEVPVKEVTLVQDDGTKGTKEAQEIFWLKQSSDAIGTHANNFSENWIPLSETTEGSVKTYVFGYKTKLTEAGSTEPLFDKVQLKNILENEISTEEKLNINVSAYAIQAESILHDNAAIDTSGNMTEDTLRTIYQIYVTQNAGN